VNEAETSLKIRGRATNADCFFSQPHRLPPLDPSPLLRLFPLPLPLLRDSPLFLDALSFLLP
jgi:hypothetical protein